MFDWLEATPFGDTLTVFEVLVSFVGVGGGGYVGGRGIATRRLRTEYRSDVINDLIPRLERALEMDARAFEDCVRNISIRTDALSLFERQAWRRTLTKAGEDPSLRESRLRLFFDAEVFGDYLRRRLRPGGPLRRIGTAFKLIALLRGLDDPH